MNVHIKLFILLHDGKGDVMKKEGVIRRSSTSAENARYAIVLVIQTALTEAASMFSNCMVSDMAEAVSRLLSNPLLKAVFRRRGAWPEIGMEWDYANIKFNLLWQNREFKGTHEIYYKD